VHEAIANLLESRQIRNRSVVTAVSGRAVIVKKILMDRLSEEDAKEAIQWEAEQHVPYDINDVSLDFQIINPNVDQKKMQVLLVAAKKEMIQNHADIIREAGLTPVIIDVDSFAIQNCVEANYDLRSDEVVALVNIGAEITNVNIVENQVPHFTTRCGARAAASPSTSLPSSRQPARISRCSSTARSPISSRRETRSASTGSFSPADRPAYRA